MTELFNTLLVNPILNLLVLIYQLLSGIGIGNTLGFSIILMTVVIRFLLYPLFNSQMKASHKMQKMNPHISKLREKHKGDAKRIQEETMKLYKEHGINPLMGCLPVLLQMPIIFGLYSVIQESTKANTQEVLNHINKVVYFDWLKLTQPWSTDFFGIPLSQSPSQLMNTLIVVAVAVPVLTALFQFIQSKMMYPASETVPVLKKDSSKKKKTDTQEDFAKVFQTQSMYIFPVMIGFFSFTFPVGLSLYWNTFTIFAILQQYKISGFGGLEPWIQQTKLWIKKNKKS